MYYLTEAGKIFVSEGQVPSTQFAREAQTRAAMRRLSSIEDKRRYYRMTQELRKAPRLNRDAEDEGKKKGQGGT